jgi:hypothetical protein
LKQTLLVRLETDQGPADYIAALNIAARGAVSLPTVPRNLLEHQALLRDKPTISIVGS